MAQRIENSEYAKQCIRFVEHIKKHIALGETGDKNDRVICKICDRKFDDIGGIWMKERFALVLVDEQDGKKKVIDRWSDEG